jgi:putative colanic acid biosynthesis UDP-glucose lipid carrier transferase
LPNISEDKIAYSNKRFSGFIKPISYLVDLTVITCAALYLFHADFEIFTFGLFIGICWMVISMQIEFYKIRRNTAFTTLLGKIVKQSVFFLFVVFAFFGYFYELNRESTFILTYVGVSMGSIAILKISLFFFLKNYRSVLGGNYRTVVILGKNPETEKLHSFFQVHDDLGYRSQRIVDLHQPNFDLQGFMETVLDENIDEIFCSVKELGNEQLVELTDFADNNLRTLKFIPDTDAVLSKHLEYDYYGLTPVISLREIPLDDLANKIAKRAFDIVFSLCVILGLLSWLIPIVAIIIKIESKGPIFFLQKRNGLDYHEFTCFKFRSMVPNKIANINQVSRGDKRITKIGRFLRKTSIDELPQFFNVLLGQMSVVGPRPHMVSHTNMYARRIDKFMVRHFVKPGITGLAQVSGYRGEVETEEDIKGRVRNDIFYIENWSTFMDLKIIFKTIANVFSGEDKAY